MFDLEVEVAKKDQEEQRAETLQIHGMSRNATVDDEGQSSVNEGDYKLDQLHLGQIFLPPQIFLQLRSHG